MFVLMTVGAKQFPVAAIGRVVVVIVVLVMHFEQLQIGMIESARTSVADPGKQFQSLRPVTLFPFFGAASRLKDKTIKSFIGWCHRDHYLSVEEIILVAAQLSCQKIHVDHQGVMVEMKPRATRLSASLHFTGQERCHTWFGRFNRPDQGMRHILGKYCTVVGRYQGAQCPHQ